MEQPTLIIGLSGFTKVQKSGLARLVKYHCGFDIVEMSDPVRTQLQRDGTSLTITGICEMIENLRLNHGKDILAKFAIETIRSKTVSGIIVAGIRSYDDHMLLRNTFSSYKLIYIHSSTETRHKRLCK